MARLQDVAKSIKSANAGATYLTFDIVMPTDVAFAAVCASPSLQAGPIAAIYGVPAEEVAIYHYAPARTVKLTIPRNGVWGGFEERDFDGVQQYIPLLNLEIVSAEDAPP